MLAVPMRRLQVSGVPFFLIGLESSDKRYSFSGGAGAAVLLAGCGRRLRHFANQHIRPATCLHCIRTIGDVLTHCLLRLPLFSHLQGHSQWQTLKRYSSGCCTRQRGRGRGRRDQRGLRAASSSEGEAG